MLSCNPLIYKINHPKYNESNQMEAKGYCKFGNFCAWVYFHETFAKFRKNKTLTK